LKTMNRKRYFLLLLVMAGLVGCATVPTGPSVMVMPGPGKPFEVFQADDFACRQWAGQQIGGENPQEAGNKTLAGGAVIGTMVGAAMGALIGSTYGEAGAGAAIGAGGGLLGGTMMASDSAQGTRWELQRRYDIAYQQCMFAKGNQIPGSVQRQRQSYPPPPPPPGSAQGTPVPPPPNPYPSAPRY
jgi:hypothetical protein